MSAPSNQPDELFAVRTIENAWIPLTGGLRLAARIWLPENAERSPVPAILEYLPYRKRDGTRERDALNHPWFAARGYACIRVDIRGTGESDGLLLDEYTQAELDDGVTVIDWISAQPWCDGNVGMMGISWGGFNALQIAALRPPALKAIIAVCATDDRYADDIHYKGGALALENFGWGATMFSLNSLPPDPDLVGERWRDMWVERLNALENPAARWLSHQHRDAYWEHGSVCEDYGAITTPVLSVGGWLDCYSNPVPRLAANLSTDVLAINGPWIHRYPHIAVPNPIGFLQEAMRWWDRWLKNVDNDVMASPQYRCFMPGPVDPAPFETTRNGRWVAEPSWPSPNITFGIYTLNAGTLVRHHPVDQAGYESAHGDALPDAICSAEDNGVCAGELGSFWFGPENPVDQRDDDASSVCFDSPPLNDALEILGAPVLRVTLTSDKPVARLVVRLCDVAEDGTSTRVSWGVLNLCHRNGHDRPQALEQDQRYTLDIQLDDTAWRFAPGHRIRVALSTNAWPLLWPLPERATLQLHHQPANTLTLPERLNTSNRDVHFESPTSARAAPIEQLAEPDKSRHVERDPHTGRTTVTVINDFGQQRFHEHGLVTDASAHETFSVHPDDPDGCEATAVWIQGIGRERWQIETVTRSRLTSTRTQFVLETGIEARENGQTVLERRVIWRIPRRFV